VSRHLGRERALRAIEQDLVRSDPRLNALFLSLTGLANGRKMPDTERIKTRPLWRLALLGRQVDRHRASADRPAQHRTNS